MIGIKLGGIMKVLVTGFDPFGGESINPAYEAVNNMQDRIGVCEIVKLLLPTVFNKSLQVLETAIEKEQPDMVICVGQAGGRSCLSVERVAINLDEARISDNEGHLPQGIPIKQDGENAYFTNLPTKAIVKALTEHNIPGAISYTAGTFVCNHVFYGLMYMIDKKLLKVKGGFIHVPYIPEQVLSKAQMPSMALNTITKALEIIVKTAFECNEDINYPAGETH